MKKILFVSTFIVFCYSCKINQHVYNIDDQTIILLDEGLIAKGIQDEFIKETIEGSLRQIKIKYGKEKFNKFIIITRVFSGEYLDINVIFKFYNEKGMNYDIICYKGENSDEQDISFYKNSKNNYDKIIADFNECVNLTGGGKDPVDFYLIIENKGQRGVLFETYLWGDQYQCIIDKLKKNEGTLYGEIPPVFYD